jgi:alcohol dehydrogenase class IV
MSATRSAEAQDIAARSDALYGAWLCGAVLGHVAMGLHHKLCHTLGGSFNLPHAEVHTVVLPHALAYNAASAPQAMARIARALGAGDPATALQALAKRLGAPTSLREIGMPADGLDRAAGLATTTPYPNPRALERGALRALLQRAFDGAAPQP